MSRCSSFMQFKCNWYCMGTIALTVNRNNCKTPLLETASRLLFQKNYSPKTTPQI